MRPHLIPLRPLGWPILVAGVSIGAYIRCGLAVIPHASPTLAVLTVWRNGGGER